MLTIALAGYGYLVIVNLLSLFAFALDKTRARNRSRRVPEGFLLTLAAIGGWIGAKLGQHLYARAARSERFGALINVVPAGHAILVMVAALGLTAVSA